jgi:hypothetical protein
MKQRLLRWSGLVTISTGVLLILWWGLMGTMVPSGGDNVLLEMVRNSNWVIINALGSIHAVLLPLALIGLYARQVEEVGALGLVGFVLAFLGAVLTAWIQVEETLLWPLLAAHAPDLVDMKGPMFADTAFFATYILMGAFFIPGSLILGVATARAKVLPRWGAILLAVGAPLFGIGGLFLVVRTIGALLFTAALIWLGVAQWKRTPKVAAA